MKIAVLLGDLNRAAAVVPGALLGELDRQGFESLRAALGALPHEFLYISNHQTLIDELRSLAVDLVLNFCDEGFENDLARELHLPALLEMLGLPYTGGAPRCLACCYDKAIVRGVAAELGIPTARGVLHAPGTDVTTPSFGFPAMVKPNFGDGSFGITALSVVHNQDELARAVFALREIYRGAILVEEYLSGSDIDAGAVGNTGSWTIYPLSSVDYSSVARGIPRIESHDFKWQDESPYAQTKIICAEIPAEIEAAIRAWSVQLLDRLECRDYARVDWRLDEAGAPRLLEVNPNTGWGASGRLADMAALAGVSYLEMLAAIIDAAARRLGCKR